MKEVSYREYNEEFINFVQKHTAKGDLKIYTSSMVGNRYQKEYCWSHGANWCEVTKLIKEIKEVESHGLTFKVEIEMWRTEFWSTESGSKVYYCY